MKTTMFRTAMMLAAAAHVPAAPIPDPASGFDAATDPTMNNSVPRDENYFAAARRPAADERMAGFTKAWQEFARAPRVRVLVGLEVPDYERRRDESIAAWGKHFIQEADERLAASIKAAADSEIELLPPGSFEVRGRFQSLAALDLEVDAEALAALEASPSVSYVTLDTLAAPTLDDTTDIIGAVDAWSVGLTGTGWYVAVLDTGIRASHEAFAGKHVIQACFSHPGICPNGDSKDLDSPDAARHFAPPYYSDHGTHVSGIAAGDDPSGSAQNDGVARGADIIALQVFHPVDGAQNCNGQPHCSLASSNDVVRGLDHVYSLRSTLKIAAVNLSLGGGQFFSAAQCDAASPTYYNSLANLRSVGIAPLVASGNDDYCGSLSSPACLTPAIAVGATENDDDEAVFSNFHPTMLDLYAPGVEIFAPIGSGDSDYGNKSGTSMAAPHVAGAFALLRNAAPTATLDQLLTALETTGANVDERCQSATQRRIDVSGALDLLLNQNSVWVNFSWAGSENGTWRAPFNTIAEGILSVPPSGTIWLYPGSTSVLPTILTPMTLQAPYGPVTMGA